MPINTWIFCVPAPFKGNQGKPSCFGTARFAKRRSSFMKENAKIRQLINGQATKKKKKTVVGNALRAFIIGRAMTTSLTIHTPPPGGATARTESRNEQIKNRGSRLKSVTCVLPMHYFFLLPPRLTAFMKNPASLQIQPLSPQIQNPAK